MAAMTIQHTANVHWAHKPQATQQHFTNRRYNLLRHRSLSAKYFLYELEMIKIFFLSWIFFSLGLLALHNYLISTNYERNINGYAKEPSRSIR